MNQLMNVCNAIEQGLIIKPTVSKVRSYLSCSQKKAIILSRIVRQKPNIKEFLPDKPLMIKSVCVCKYYSDMVADITYNGDKQFCGKAFTVQHVNECLAQQQRYNNIIDLLEKEHQGELEYIFIREWIKRFYCNDAPALIPQVNNFLIIDNNNRHNFSYQIDNERAKNGRIDFFVYNTLKGKCCFIEIDGKQHGYEKQRIIDCVKRNTLLKTGIPMVVFTSDMIRKYMNYCMNLLEDIFSVRK